MIDQANKGKTRRYSGDTGRAQKGDFAHWHHEMFEATPDNLANYLKGGKSSPKTIIKFDSVGQRLN